MEVRNVTKSDILLALSIVNKLYDDNIRIKDMRMLRAHTKAGPNEVWQVTLTVNSTHTKIVDSLKPRRVHTETLPGVKISPRGDKRIAAACWHVYGHFMDALPADCIIVSGVNTGTGKPAMRSPGDEWFDFNVGSYYMPAYASQCCECGEY